MSTEEDFSTGSLSQEKCNKAVIMKQDSQLLMLFALEEVFAVITLLCLWYLSRSNEFRRLTALLSVTLKKVATIGICFYFVCSVTNMLFYLYSIFLYSRELDSCDYVWSNYACHIVRYTTRCCSVGYTTLHVLLLVERFNCAFGITENERFAWVLQGLMLIIPLFFVWITFREESVTGYQIYCYAGSQNAMKIMLITKYVLVTLDVISSVGDLALLFYNKYQLKNKSSKYNLKKSFELREMQISIKIIFPMTLIHTLGIIPYFYLSSVSLKMSIYDETRNFVIFTEYSMIAKAFYSAVVPFSVCILHQITRTRQITTGEWKKSPNMNMADKHFEQLEKYFEVARRKN